ncbi:unnamed protein product [Caenorhabditis auriculariae]|uniref:Uncharacterized protein n=1 Tax=Caenorhabditis auriculariae TaxID=2777116 RepID=A0A8S1GUT1_9PELO|nr:unnamed protein product [Caenorhabditis auriculariae]
MRVCWRFQLGTPITLQFRTKKMALGEQMILTPAPWWALVMLAIAFLVGIAAIGAALKKPNTMERMRIIS